MSRNDNAEGVRLYQQGNYLGAVNHFQEALARQPGDPDCFYNLGATYHQQAKLFSRPADLSTAEQYYHLCLARDPGHEACRRALSVLLVEEGREPEAVAGLQEWARLQPGNPQPHIEMARLWQERGDLREAENQLIDALAVSPNNPRALVALANIREQAGDPTQALNNYQRALAADPAQPVVAARVAALSSSVPQRTATLPPAAAAAPPGGQWTAATPAR
jgi:tetratricopeptide (TPR) repeat protein